MSRLPTERKPHGSCRVRRLMTLTSLPSEMRYAVRSLSRRRGFALLVVVTLGLGIGATTTTYSVVDAVLVRQLPYEDADRLAAVGVTFPGREWDDQRSGLQHLAGTAYLNYEEVKRRARSFDRLEAAERRSILMPDRGEGPELVQTMAITPGFMELLSVRPALGRLLLEEDFAPDAEPVALLSHASWQSRYGGDSEVLSGDPATSPEGIVIVGVLPRGFSPPEALFPSGPEFWTPIKATDPRYQDRGRRSLNILGRLREGAQLDSARAELTSIGEEIAREFPDGSVYPDGTAFGYGVNALHAETVGTSGRTLSVFFAAAVLLLLIACLNAANLLALRGLDRIGELDLRRALGAGRWQLARQVMVESLLLAVAGGLLGVLIALLGVEAFLRFAPQSIPRLAEVSVNPRILLATAVVSMSAGLMTGLTPILALPHQMSLGVRRRAAATVTASGARTRMVLVTAQLALALILGVGASLLFHSFIKLRTIDPGFDPEGLVTLTLPMKGDPASEPWQKWDELFQVVGAVPGVEAVAGGSDVPFESPSWAPRIQLPGDDPELVREGIAGYAVSPDFFETTGMRVLRGRGFSVQDGPGSTRVAVVNEAFLREVGPQGEALGATLYSTGLNDEDRFDNNIVGVVADVVQSRAEEGFRPAVYFPHTQADWPYTVKVVVRSEREVAELAGDLRRAAAEFSPGTPVLGVQSMNDRIRSVHIGPRFQALLFGCFALVAVLLAAVGLYGTLSHTVGSRMSEFGIRIALGANRAGIYGLVLRQGAVVVVAGLGLGLVGALILTRFLNGFLFQVGSFDAPTFAVAVVSLAAVAGFAVLTPARRATRVDVVDSLQAD